MVFVENVDRMIQNAATCKPEEYLNWCDTVEGFESCKDNKFGDPTCKYGDRCVVQLNEGYWSDVPACIDRDGHVRTYTDPGIYIETYIILAVNRTEETAWAVYVNMREELPTEAYLPRETAEAVCREFNIIFEKKQRKYSTDSYSSFEL
jgi:hypothetical protein